MSAHPKWVDCPVCHVSMRRTERRAFPNSHTVTKWKCPECKGELLFIVGKGKVKP